MSTKATMAHGDLFHLYEEMTDETAWLETQATDFIATPSGVRFHLKPEIIEAIVTAYRNKRFPHQREETNKEKG